MHRKVFQDWTQMKRIQYPRAHNPSDWERMGQGWPRISFFLSFFSIFFLSFLNPSYPLHRIEILIEILLKTKYFWPKSATPSQCRAFSVKAFFGHGYYNNARTNSLFFLILEMVLAVPTVCSWFPTVSILFIRICMQTTASSTLSCLF